MITAYALERWAIEIVSLVALVGWLVLFWAVPMLTGMGARSTPTICSPASPTRR